MNPMLQILIENATTFKERNAITSLMESEKQDVTNKLLTELYQSAVKKSDIDFDTIPDSKGDIVKYKGHPTMQRSLDALLELSSKQGVRIPEIVTVQTALNNLVSNASTFEKAFRLDKHLLIMMYNTLVHACVVATSELISSYADFIRTPESFEFKMVKGNNEGSIMIKNLDSFNETVRNGSFGKTANGLINTNEKQLVGVDDFFIPALVVGGLMAIVPLMRELIFGFYYSRMKTSEYLAQQAAFLEINKAAIESSSRTLREKKAIITKQDKVARKLTALSDKIKVSSKMGKTNATADMKKEESKWRISDVQDDISVSKASSAGFSLL